MSKFWPVLGSFLFLVLAPGTVAGLAPWLISHWHAGPHASVAMAAPGVVLIALGLIPLLDSFRRFAVEGLGTPAPIAPTRHLVVSGFYRFVRNPMYVGVVSLVLGQALVFASLALAAYGLAIWLTMHLFVVFYEEPKLHRSFGAEYDAFRAAVPRWLPRMRGWE